ncbi:MAG TPA: amylo-alpha-1,6-glucosidase [Gemmatimonadales bacterium]|jgi:predicted glycogen debranching enzyme
MSTRPILLDDQTEWLEPDGLGGFASGTTSGLRARRYHALLLAATTPPTGRMVLVNGLDAWVEAPPAGPAEAPVTQEYLTRQRYQPGVVAPEHGATLDSFTNEPWPTWVYRLAGGGKIEHDLFVPSGSPLVVLRWRLVGKRLPVRLFVRPFLSGRDSHSTHHENAAFRFSAEQVGNRVVWQPYEGVPSVTALSNGSYAPDPQWYRGFFYAEEQARGLDAVEDLAAPGVFAWNLAEADAVMVLAAGDAMLAERAAGTLATRLRRAERARRARFASPLVRAADAYLVRRGHGKTIVAGYPWFTDWGRDTFISLRGLCLATERLGEARSILLEWAGLVSEGMLPNRFVDQGDAPEYNTIDASLWYVIAVHDYLAAMNARGLKVAAARDQRELGRAVEAILAGHIRGSRYRIRVAEDGLLAGGEPGVQLTWMDAKVGDWVVTPRVGKPVEIQALWLNALRVAELFTPAYRAVYDRGMEAFAHRFWKEDGGYLYDVVDVDHEAGRVDASFRPNQIFAVGGLPYPLIEGARARQIVDQVEQVLWTPLGLRTLAPGSPGYQPVYQGDVRARDGAYHQGTVWPWLLGAFVDAWVRVRGHTAEARREARQRFLAPLLDHLSQAGLGHISEIADADPPFTPRGCPFQAWSVGEALRVDFTVLAEPRVTAPGRSLSAAVP